MYYDVAIVGAGAAGIAAARRLAAAGKAVVLLEASDRVGGRAWTLDIAGMPLDLGCGWLHSADRNSLAALGEATGFTIDRTASVWRRQWRDLGFPPADQQAAGAAWEALETRLHDDSPSTDRAADALPAAGRWNAFCQALSGYINGAALDRLSIADFLTYDDAASDANWRVRAGYGTLVASSLPPVALRLATPVRRIVREADGVRVETDRGTLRAGAAVVTVSTNVLAAGTIAFESAADDHLHAATHLPLGLADKVFIELLDDHGLEPDTHLLGNPHDPRTGSYYIRPFGRSVIEGFFGGPGAQRIEDEGEAGAFAFAIDELAALLGSGIRRHLRPLVASAWCRTDWVRGSYSHALPGHAGARATLAQPLDGLLFAGEATHPTDFSTAHGAWQSGLRAADEVLAVAP